VVSTAPARTAAVRAFPRWQKVSTAASRLYVRYVQSSSPRTRRRSWRTRTRRALNRPPHDHFVASQGAAHCLRRRLPEPGRALDVGEEERHRPRRPSHAPESPMAAPDAPRNVRALRPCLQTSPDTGHTDEFAVAVPGVTPPVRP
jgi:hypothetical protein